MKTHAKPKTHGSTGDPRDEDPPQTQVQIGAETKTQAHRQPNPKTVRKSQPRDSDESYGEQRERTGEQRERTEKRKEKKVRREKNFKKMREKEEKKNFI
jgi:hypothetical protein